MSDLTTSARFKTYAGITGTSQDTLIGQLITEVSAAIEQYLRRTLVATTYKVWLDGTGSPMMRLKQWPILALYQMSITSSSVGYVVNNSSTVSRASVSFDGTNLSLSEMSTAGAHTISELPVATSKTMSALEAAIEAKTGWSCVLNSTDYEGEPSSLLRPIYGQDALDPSLADLYLPDDPEPVKVVTEDCVELIHDHAFAPYDIFPATIPRECEYGFPRGTANIFAWFKAGYTLPTDESAGTLPGGLLLLVNQIVSDVLSSTKLNSNLQSESIGGYSYSLRATAKGAVASAIENRKSELNQYRSVSI